MADKKITDMTALAAGSQAIDDLVTVVDISEAAAANRNKKMTMESLFKGVPSDVGIGTSTPNAKLEIQEAATSGADLIKVSNSADTAELVIDTASNAVNLKPGSGDTLALFSPSAAALQIDTDGNSKFTSNSRQIIFRNDGTAGSPELEFRTATDNGDADGIIRGSTLLFGKNGTDFAKFDTNGNLGIGNTSPDAKLHVESSTTGADLLKLANSTDTAQLIIDTGSNVTNLKPGTGDAVALWGPSAEKMRVDANGVKVTEGQPISWHDGSGNNSAQISGDSSDNLILSNTSSNTERFRVGPAGQLGIGGATYGTSGQALISGGGSAAPTWGTPTATAGQVIETFAALCDGRQVTVGSGTYTTSTYTAGQIPNGLTYGDLSGSNLTYTPPSGTNVLIYEFSFQWAWDGTATAPINHFRFYWNDGSAFQEVTAARRTMYFQWEDMGVFQTVLSLNNSTQDIANGKIGTWNTAREMKIMSRGYSGVYYGKFHQTRFFDGVASSNNVPPILKITAIA